MPKIKSNSFQIFFYKKQNTRAQVLILQKFGENSSIVFFAKIRVQYTFDFRFGFFFSAFIWQKPPKCLKFLFLSNYMSVYLEKKKKWNYG